MQPLGHYTAFEGQEIFCQGDFAEVILKIKRKIGHDAQSSILIFSDATGKTMDFNFEGQEKDVLRRLEVYAPAPVQSPEPGPGRPKLGVISREVTLLPRHWEWLANQPSGASASLRLLIDEAIKHSGSSTEVKAAQERTYRFMTALAGDLSGYEEALRSLYKKDLKSFSANMANWPQDIKNHALALAKPAFNK